jgi:hypothetical protein
MAAEKRGERLQLMLTPEELIVLDDFRFRARMPSRASVVRELLRRGLAVEGFDAASFGAKSEDFGVTGSGADSQDGQDSR